MTTKSSTLVSFPWNMAPNIYLRWLFKSIDVFLTARLYNFFSTIFFLLSPSAILGITDHPVYYWPAPNWPDHVLSPVRATGGRVNTLGHELANYGPSGLPPIYVNKVFLVTVRFLRLPIVYGCFWATLKSRAGTETTWPTNPKIFTIWPLYRKSLPTPILENFWKPSYGWATPHLLQSFSTPWLPNGNSNSSSINNWVLY